MRRLTRNVDWSVDCQPSQFGCELGPFKYNVDFDTTKAVKTAGQPIIEYSCGGSSPFQICFFFPFDPFPLSMG